MEPKNIIRNTLQIFSSEELVAIASCIVLPPLTNTDCFFQPAKSDYQKLACAQLATATLVKLVGAQLRKVECFQQLERYERIVRDMDLTFQQALADEKFPSLQTLYVNLTQVIASGDEDTYRKLEIIANGVFLEAGYEVTKSESRSVNKDMNGYEILTEDHFLSKIGETYPTLLQNQALSLRTTYQMKQNTSSCYIKK